MQWIDRLERIGRIVLLLSIAAAFVIAPIEYTRQHRIEAEWRDASLKAEHESRVEAEKTDLAAHELHRLSLASMGSFLSALVPSAAGGDQGTVWFTNVSPRTGFLCVYGKATNRSTQRTTSSLPSCANIAAYASTAHLSLMFAGGELRDACPKQGDCDMVLHDASEPRDSPLDVPPAGAVSTGGSGTWFRAHPQGSVEPAPATSATSVENLPKATTPR
jgi:hypothetical protein